MENIEFKDKKKVIDVKSMNDDELWELRSQLEDTRETILNEFDKETKGNEEFRSKLVSMLAVFTVVAVGHAIGDSFSGNLDVPAATATLGGFGLLISSTEGFFAGLNKIKEKRKNKKLKELDEILKPAREEQIDRWDKRHMISCVEETKENIQWLYKKLMSIDKYMETKKFRLDGKEEYLKKLIEEGADSELVMSPAVQAVMNSAVLYPRARYEMGEIKQDGSFTVVIKWATKENGDYIVSKPPIIYDVKKLDDGNVEVINRDNIRIYYNKDGEITNISKKIAIFSEYDGSRYGVYEISMDKDGKFSIGKFIDGDLVIEENEEIKNSGKTM